MQFGGRAGGAEEMGSGDSNLWRYAYTGVPTSARKQTKKPTRRTKLLSKSGLMRLSYNPPHPRCPRALEKALAPEGMAWGSIEGALFYVVNYIKDVFAKTDLSSRLRLYDI